jgi:hypothetical protein
VEAEVFVAILGASGYTYAEGAVSRWKWQVEFPIFRQIGFPTK